MSDDSDGSEDASCEYSLSPTDAEVDAISWLQRVMKEIYVHKRSNSERALVVSQFLI